MSDNLEFWNSVEKTNPEHTKKVQGKGRNLTAINAHQQIKSSTEKWGMYGKKWGLKDIQLNYIKDLVNNQILAVAQAIFYYPDGSFDIGSSIFVQSWLAKKKYLSVDDDFLKKLETDMTTKALSKLGFNADVFFGKFDDNKYVKALLDEFKEPEPLKELLPDHGAFTKAVEQSITIEQLREYYTISPLTETAYKLALKDHNNGK